MALVVRELRRSDRRGDFACGVSSLDEYLAKHARSDMQKGYSRTWVCVEAPSASEIRAYVTLAAASVHPSQVAIAKRQQQVPALLVARWATHAAFGRQGLGVGLIAHAANVAQEMRERCGCVGLLVDALPGALEVYEKLGFERRPCEAVASGTTPFFMRQAVAREIAAAYAS